MIEDIFDGGHRRASRQVEALGWKDLAVPAAGLALMSPFVNTAPAQAAPAGGQNAVTQQAQRPVKKKPKPKPPAPKPTAQQSWAATQQAMNAIVGRPVTLSRETPEFMQREAPGMVLAFVVLDDSFTIHISPTVATYLDYPSSMTYVQGIAQMIHEAVHLKHWNEDKPNAARAIDEAATNRAAIAMAPGIIKRFYPWLANDPSVTWSINRALIELTPPEYH